MTQAKPSDAANMLSREEVIEIVERQARAWENRDAEAIANDFAEDAVFVVPGMKFEGRTKIKAAAEDYFKQFTDTKVEIKNTIIEGDRGAVEWNWRDRSKHAQKLSYAEDAIIFELEEDKIIYWREYIEKKSPSS
ncbi:nuclear transport factor 2 family protein [Myxosarcina sp. GI1]|uniref:nuclear transport factor 2 family protein n=1 Tax=Myxosarcina sp. GI1 TaxID=1541065 RepID=UPI0020A186A8|nr:nuclear transport factor 2 family protein [Myxosarcina sp. GI1]